MPFLIIIYSQRSYLLYISKLESFYLILSSKGYYTHENTCQLGLRIDRPGYLPLPLEKARHGGLQVAQIYIFFPLYGLHVYK
jgi:hypothetical protein